MATISGTYSPAAPRSLPTSSNVTTARLRRTDLLLVVGIQGNLQVDAHISAVPSVGVRVGLGDHLQHPADAARGKHALVGGAVEADPASRAPCLGHKVAFLARRAGSGSAPSGGMGRPGGPGRPGAARCRRGCLRRPPASSVGVDDAPADRPGDNRPGWPLRYGPCRIVRPGSTWRSPGSSPACSAWYRAAVKPARPLHCGVRALLSGDTPSVLVA